MCGIVAILNVREQTHELREQALKMSQKIRHRGPDWSGIYCGGSAILAHERLSIVDPESGGQPLFSPDRQQILAVNGEIYNHFLIARDPIGVIPLYIGYDSDGKVLVASELKALEGQCDHYEPFLPGHYFYSGEWREESGERNDSAFHSPLKRYYKRDWMQYDAVKDNPASVEAIHDALEDAVKRQLMSDVPYGVLLSGGLDSSVISAIAEKYSELHSFAVGLKGAPDLAKAKLVADHIGTVHHEINYTIQEGLDAIRDVIYFIETYDVTTVRASTPMYLLARVIKSMGIKMVLSGEGADEIFGGYLYFHKAPSAKDFHEETVRKLSKLHLYDCLRANKSLSAAHQS